MKINLILSFFLSGIALCGCSTHQSGTAARTQGVYSEFGSFKTSSFQLLQQTNTALLLAVYPSGSTYSGQIGSSELLNVIHQAVQNGVSVRLWPMLSQADGVWPNEDNVDLFTQEVDSLLTWLNANKVKPGWLIFDLEPPYSLTMSMTTIAQTGNTFSALSLLISYMSPSTFRYALERFTELVESVHQKGWKVECVTYPLVLDDRYDSNSGMQVLFHIPVLGVPWDQISFMVYQSSFKSLLGKWFGPSLVASYAKDAYAMYDKNAVIALGVIGNDPLSGIQGYTSTTELFDDVSAALGQGITHIEIYSLDEILSQNDPYAWLNTSTIKPESFSVTTDVQSTRQLIQTFAKSLDTNL
ncbi:MAG: hypothetical protein M1591_03560 [Deltaproteobacteria bacterium]|nr:hypothetical protein [Deltaproteobacteria bacterium]